MTKADLNKITEELYREYKDHVFNYLYRLSNNYELALDITQHTFLKILSDKNILSLKSPKAYLFTIARNSLYNEWKKKKESPLTDDNQVEQIPDEQTAIPDDDASQVDLKDKIEVAIKSLPEKSRELMLLHYTEGLSYQEITTVTGRKLSDIKVNLHRARHRFDTQFTTQMYRKVAASRQQCDQISILLKPYTHDEIPDSQIDVIDAHITACNICNDDAQEMKRTRQLFSLLPLFLAPSIIDQIFNQSLGVAVAATTTGTSSTGAASSVATGASKVTAAKVVASAVVVGAIVTGGILLTKPNTESTPTTAISSTSNTQGNTTTAQARAFNPSTDASLEIQKTVMAGSTLKVKWTGPQNNLDKIAILENNKTKKVINYQYPRNNKPVDLVMPEKSGVYDIVYLSEKGDVLAKTSVTVLKAKATLNTVKSVVAGSDFVVNWTGPQNYFDKIAVLENESQNKVYNYQHPRNNKPVKLKVPETVGTYDVVYLTAKGTVLAKTSVNVIKAQVTLNTVTTVVAGSDFIVNWTGPQNYFDKIAVLENDGLNKVYNYQHPRNNKPVKLKVPEVIGKYDVVYLTEKGRVLAKTSVTVIKAKVTLNTVKTVVAGSDFIVNWTGPQNYFDKIAVLENKGLNQVYNYQHPRNNKPVKLKVPEVVGQYDVVYLTEKGRTLAKTSVTVTEATATLDTVKSVIEGSDFIVNWTGPQNYFDKVAILENNGTSKIFKYQHPRNKKPVKLTVPEISGKYEVVYLSKQGRVLAKTSVTVTEAKATLQTNKSVAVGSLLIVNWTGPQNYFDKIAIMDNKKSNKIFDSRHPRNNKPVSLKVPKAVGSYNVVYLTKKGRVLAKTSITVIAK